MDVLHWVIENWYFIVTGAVLIGMGIVTIFEFFQMPQKSQVAKVKQWLLLAVVEAEKQLGVGTGQLKLRKVYDWFVQRFPSLAVHISFDTFAAWVDEALEEMQSLIKENSNIQKYLAGEQNGFENQMGKQE